MSLHHPGVEAPSTCQGSAPNTQFNKKLWAQKCQAPTGMTESATSPLINSVLQSFPRASHKRFPNNTRGIVEETLSLSNRLINLWRCLDDKHYLMEREKKTPDQTDTSHPTANPRRDSDRGNVLRVEQGSTKQTGNHICLVSFNIRSLCVNKHFISHLLMAATTISQRGSSLFTGKGSGSRVRRGR